MSGFCSFIRRPPGLLEDGLDLLRVKPAALGLLPFLPRKGQRVAQAAILKPARHFPAMIEVKLARDIAQLHFVVGQIDRAHALRIDP